MCTCVLVPFMNKSSCSSASSCLLRVVIEQDPPQTDSHSGTVVKSPRAVTVLLILPPRHQELSVGLRNWKSICFANQIHFSERPTESFKLYPYLNRLFKHPYTNLLASPSFCTAPLTPPFVIIRGIKPFPQVPIF